MLIRMLVALLSAAVSVAPSSSPPETVAVYRATLIGSNVRTSQVWTDGVVIRVERWSTDAERKALLTALRAGRPGGLQEALKELKTPVGYFSPGGLSAPIGETDAVPRDTLVFASETREPDGTRRVQLLSAYAASAFWVELTLQGDGTGDGHVDLVVDLATDGSAQDIVVKTRRWQMSLARVRVER